MQQAIGALILVVLVLLLLRLVGVLYGSAFLWHGRTRSSTVLAGDSLSGLRPSFVSYCPKGRLRGGASGMSVERLGLIVVGMLVLLVLILFVSTAMMCRLPCY